MKKLLIIASIALVAVLALGVTGFAFAQSSTPQSPGAPGAGQGQGGWTNGAPRLGLGGRAGQFGGMGAFAARAGNGYGLMHTEMLTTFAQAFNTTQEELQTRLDAGETMWAIAQEKGFSADQFTQLMQQTRNTVLQQAVADGTLTQAQADWMQQHNYPEGYGPGSANCDGTGIRQRGGRMQNFNQQ